MSDNAGRSRLEAARRSKLAQQSPLVCEDEPQRHYTQVHNNVGRCALLSDGAFRTYFNIKSHYWGRGSCFPGLQTLARYQGVNERTIRRNIAELEVAGLLRTERRGLGLTNEYHIPSAQHWTPAQLEAAASVSQLQSGHVRPIRPSVNGSDTSVRSGSDTSVRSGSDTSVRLRRHSSKKTQKEEDTGVCAASAAPAPTSTQEHAMADAIVSQSESEEAVPQAAPHGCAKSNGRQRKMTDEEKAAVQTALDRFNDRLRPIVDDEYGRFIREALSGIRGFGLEHYLRTINLMATAERFVGDPAVTPLTVTKTVPIWEDNGEPRTWRELQERKKRRLQNGRH